MAGRLLGLLVNLVVFPVGASIIGYGIFDSLYPLINEIANMPMDAINTLTYLKMIFVGGIFVFVFALGWNHIVQNHNETDMVS